MRPVPCRRPLGRVVAVLLLSATAGACRGLLSTVIDLPPPRPQSADVTALRLAPVSLLAAEDSIRPAIERILSPDSARALLPRDHAGNIDWVAALRSGIISPRSVLPNRRPLEPGVPFGYDFYFPGPDSTLDALFRHSTHTEWLQCQSCHPRLFPRRGATFTMLDIFQGRYCAECHGKVAFPVLTGCERCHTRLTLPPDRAAAELIGTLQLRRVPGDSGNAAGMSTDELPPASFPHWVHRARYRCKACHMEVFEPRSGANAITMRDIAAGAACGICHDGRTAFPATVGTCQRCHVPAAATGS